MEDNELHIFVIFLYFYFKLKTYFLMDVYLKFNFFSFLAATESFLYHNILVSSYLIPFDKIVKYLIILQQIAVSAYFSQRLSLRSIMCCY